MLLLQHLTLFRLSPFIWLGFSNHCKLARFLSPNNKRLNILYQSIVYDIKVSITFILSLAEYLTFSYTSPSHASFLVAFAKLRKVTISFFMSLHQFVSPSCTEQLSSHWANFFYNWYLSIFQKSVGKSRVSLKSYKNNVYLHEDQYIFLIISHSVLLRIWNVSGKRCRETWHTHFTFNNFFLKIVLCMG
jgi:hypothetical protein